MTGLINAYRFGAPVVVPSPYGVFRLSTRRANLDSFFPLVAEFQLRDVAGGANRLLGATGITYSEQTSGGEAWRAFDGSLAANSRWAPGVTGYHFAWIAKAVDVAFVPVEWGIATSTATGWAPQYMDCWGSNDGSHWDLIATLKNTSYTINTLYWFELSPAKDAAYTNWRIWCAGVDGANATVAVREIELAETIGGATVTTGGSTSQVNAFDGNVATVYSFAVPGTGFPPPVQQFCEIALTSPKAIKEARITAEGVNAPGMMALQFRHPSDDNVWITVAQANNLSWSGVETKSLINPYV